MVDVEEGAKFGKSSHSCTLSPIQHVESKNLLAFPTNLGRIEDMFRYMGRSILNLQGSASIVCTFGPKEFTF